MPGFGRMEPAARVEPDAGVRVGVARRLFSPGDDAPYWALSDRIAQTSRPKTAG